MGLFSSKQRCHIQSNKVNVLNSEPCQLVESSAVDFIYLPLFVAGKPVSSTVKPGDVVKRGTLIGVNQDNFNLFSSVSGECLEEVDLFHPEAGKKVKHLKIRNDHQNTMELLTARITDFTPAEEIVNLIRDAGIVGLGGAGFPTFRKYQNAKGINMILINAVECEPYLMSDYVMIKESLLKMLNGAKILSRAANASRVVIGIKRNKVELIAKIRELLPNYDGFEVVLVPDVYPMGWERLLVKTVTGKSYNNYPSEVGIIVNNAQTAIAVHQALVEGQIVADRLVTMAGKGLVKTANILAPIGTLVSEIVKTLRGYQQEDVHLVAGGPMMGKAVNTDEFAVTLTTAGVTVLLPEKWEEEPCLHCGRCVDYCPAGLMPVLIMDERLRLDATKERDLARFEELMVKRCVECGLCSYVCPSRIDVREHMRKAKSMIRIAEMLAARRNQAGGK